jgi:hypothetical protein
VKQSKWLGIGVGTLIAAIALWFGLFAIQSNRVTGLTIIAVGVVFAIYAMVIFSGVEDGQTVAFHSSLYAIVAASTLIVAFTVTESPSYLVVAPVVAIGVGGIVGLQPLGDSARTLARVGGVIVVSVIAVSVYWVDDTVYAIIAPLIPLPAVGLSDRIFDGGKRVMAEGSD